MLYGGGPKDLESKKDDVASICRRSAGSADEFPEII